MTNPCDRRTLLKATAAMALGYEYATGSSVREQPLGAVDGQPEGAKAGMEVLASGGNAVDAIVTAALVAATVAIQQTAIGGYGGHMVIARAKPRKVVAIDFNSAAPAAATSDMFPLDANGAVRDRINAYGWRAAGVPGVLAGLQLALDRYGTRTFRDVVQPAIRYAREGFALSAGLIGSIRSAATQLSRDLAAARLILDDGEVPKPGSIHRNPNLAILLETLAKENSVDSFYRGPIAKKIAAAFKAHGGLVNEADLAAYQAREVEPLRLDWGSHSIYTAPLTAGGITVLQALATLKAVGTAQANEAHARVEALRLAWHDRLRLLGDPAKATVPVTELMSAIYAAQQAEIVTKAVKEKRLAPTRTDGRPAGGTIHLSAADTAGNFVALTLTHGEAFGARVAIEELGLVLGHGMSRFDPRAGHPNCPGPSKRPLHNMCPTILCRDGEPVLTVGARGGRKIPNTVFGFLLHYLSNQDVKAAVAAPRLHTEGGQTLTLEKGWPAEEITHLKSAGYTLEQGPGATLSVVERDPKLKTFQHATR